MDQLSLAYRRLLDELPMGPMVRLQGATAMNRNEWRFPYPAKTVCSAAREKQKMHAGRVKWWQAQQAKVMKRVRKDGIQVDETIAAEYAKSASNMIHGARINVRADLQGKLNECHLKTVQHTYARDEYAGWVDVLSVMPPQMQLELDVDDYKYFFGK
jgi:hypothetical protein